MAHLCLSVHSLHQRSPSKVVLTCADRRTTAAELHRRVALLSLALVKHTHVTPGSRVGLLGLNTDLWFQVLLSVLDAGAVGCPLNWRWSPAELAAALDLIQPTVLFVDDDCMPLATQAVDLLFASNGSSSTATPWTLVRLTHSVTPTADALAGTRFGASTSLQQLMIWSEAALQPHHTADAVAAVAGPGCKHTPEHMHSGTEPRMSDTMCQPLLAARYRHHKRGTATTNTAAQLQLLQPGPQQPALIVFTSGTTGTSKGVMLSHSSLIHQALVKLAVVQYGSSDIYLHMAPLFHIGGLSSAFAMLMAGGTHVFMPRYSPEIALQLIRQHGVTSLIAVPAMMQDLTQAAVKLAPAPPPPAVFPAQEHHPARDTPSQQASSLSQLYSEQGQQLTSLQKVLVGAGGMSLQLQHAVAALFPRARLHTAYGMTEAASSMTFITVAQQQQLLAAAVAQGMQSMPSAAADPHQGVCGNVAAVCVGQPAPGIAVRVQRPADVDNSSYGAVQGRHSPPGDSHSTGVGTVGEVWTRGPHVMLGYWRDPDATSQALHPDGWLRTMDLGLLDQQGNLWLVGRVKDMIKTGGENVYAAEVEAVLMSHPAVAAAAVFGVPHPRLGEQVAAAVVLRQQWTWLDAAAAQGRQRVSQAPSDSQQPRQQQKQQEQGQATRTHLHQTMPKMQNPQHGVVAGALTVSAAVLQDHCRAAQLSPYKLPRVLVHLQQLPLNSSGKVLKTLLKQQVQQLLSAGGSSSSSSSSSGSSGSSGSSTSGKQHTSHNDVGLRASRSKL